MNTLRVLHVVLSLDVGGLERIVLDLVRSAPGMGIEPSVCCVEHPGQLAEELRRDGIEVCSLDKGPGIKLRGFTRAVRLLKRLRPDVVHTHQIGALFYVGPAARLTGVPVVVHTEHGKHFIDDRSRRILGRFGARFAHQCFTVSDDIAAEAFRYRVFPRARTSTVINGIDVERFASPVATDGLRAGLGLGPDDTVVGTVARLDPVKDQALMIRAFATARAALPRLHLLLVGDGPSRSELEALVSTLGLTGAVHFAGRQSDVLPFLRLMDLFVLSSRSEGIPLVILEAMAAGVPVLSTGVGGIPEVITHDQTGCLVPPGDDERFSTALVGLLQDEPRRRRLAQAGLRAAHERFSLSRMASEYRAAYDRLLWQEGACR